GPLAALSIGEDPQAGVRATFDTSYRALGRPEQRMFRLLGLVPGADITPAAAAAIAAIAKQEAAQLLDHLATAHLADQVAPGRFGLHDLLATYARECARQDQANSTAAIGRLLDWYLCHADAAARLLYPHMLRLDVQPAAGGATASLRDDTAALEWLDAEQRNLIAAVLWAATNGHQQVAWLLGDTLRGYFWQSRNTVDWLETAQAGFAAAVDVGDRRAQAAMQINLATANRCVHRYELAIEQYAAAAELASSSGWIEGQAGCIGNLGTIHTSMGNLRSAADCHQEALRLFRKAGQHTGEANALTNLGLTYQLLGQLHDAVDCQEQALELYRNIGSRGGRAHALDNLGELEHALGRLGPAEGHLSQAVALHREVGNRYAEAETLHDLAATQRDAGRDRQALDTAQAGLTLARDIGDRRVEARMLNLLGALKLVAASPRQAIELHRQALRLAKDSDARYPQTEALIGLAAAFGRLDHHEEAIAYAAQALASTHETSYRVLEAQAQSMLAALHLATGDHDAALDHAKRALVICQETGHRLGEARALRLIGDAMSVYKGRETARPDWQRAWAIFADIGVPEANELVNLLSDQG
ncbi:MAG TPA: tetratricopeptide repeat protein, partial [Candidatus Limnocylindrales bacterium]|nr:tetratricopeptide repeat protein [Candidatus Limnocylindrales bacterium]